MNVIRSIAEMKRWALACGAKGESISFVPTMGNLHSGHVSLVDIALNVAEKVVVSIYVNPTQFAAHEDLGSYPRTEEADLALLEAKNIDVVFMPESKEMYPANEEIEYMDVPAFAQKYEGQARPEHFRGVATVVKKLFDCVLPQHAIFGEKDFQQLLIVQDMVVKQGMDIKIHGGKIIRDEDGVAKSSRNQYLTAEERPKAAILHQSLLNAQKMMAEGGFSFSRIISQSIDFIHENGLKVDYFTIRDAVNLDEPAQTEKVIMAAARLGKTRLLDNLRVE